MDWIKVELPPEDQNRAYRSFGASPHQKLVHNYLIEQLNAVRNALENCRSEDASRLQGKASAIREHLSFIHSKDTNDVRSIFEPPK
jgi:hypothetical protein